MLHQENTDTMHQNAVAHSRSLLASALLSLVSCEVFAQEAATPSRMWALEPYVSVRQTITDNQRHQTDKESDAITEATAGARLTGTGGRVRGFADYALTGSVYARNNDANDLRHFLNAAATAEVIDDQGFVDLRGSYRQQVVSAFGSQSAEPGLNDSNRSDVGSLAISPHVRGRLGSVARYEARLSFETTRAKGTSSADVDNSAASLHFDNNTGASVLGWSADATHTISDFRAGRRTFDSRVRAGVNYLVSRELKVGVSAGRERTDLLVLGGESNPTWGVQADWTPTERTELSANVEKRFFGNSHAFRFSHRTPATVWALSDSRDISTSSSQGTASFGSAYDLFFRQLESAEPDPVRRDQLVRTLLLVNGIDPNAVIVGGFLASAATLERAQVASVALVGARNTVTLQFSGLRSERADKLTTVLDDLSNAREIRQRGLSLSWAHRLTPLSSINVTGAYQRSEGDTSSQETTLKSITATWTSPLGARSTVSAGARHSEFESATTPYDENALFAAIRVSF